MSGILNIAKKAAYLAANIIQQANHNLTKQIKEKDGKSNFVSEYDLKAEAIIIETITKAFPKHNILAEESGFKDNQSPYTWLIDPIDGTTNFIHGHPQYCISIALKHNNEITHALILDPNRNDLYQAQLGNGTYLNDKRLRVSKQSNLAHALIGTGFPTYDITFLDKYLTIFKQVLLNTCGSRRAGSAALDLAYVAAGYLDAFWEFSLKPWDIAAGYLLIKEAGGIVTDFNNQGSFLTTGNIIAGNLAIHGKLLNLIKPYL